MILLSRQIIICFYNHEFKELLEYIARNSKTMKFIFVLAESDKDKTLDLVSILSEVINLKEVDMTYPSSEYFMIYLEAILNSKKDRINNIRNKLIELVDFYCKSDDFKGYETMDKLADNINYMIKKNNEVDLSLLYKTKNKKNDKEKQYIAYNINYTKTSS